MDSTLLRNVTLPAAFAEGGGGTRDVRLRGGRIDEIGDVGRLSGRGGRGELATDEDEELVDLAGYVLLPAAVEPHAHLDKAFLAEVIDNPTGDLMGACDAMERNRHLMDVPGTVERAERAARRLATSGFRAIRTHVDVTLDNGMTSVEALLEVRDRVAEVIDIEIVALAGWPITGAAAADQRALLDAALDAGADVVGGCPHLEGDGTRAPTEYLLGVAADRGLPVDLHTDEVLDGTVLGIVDLLDIVESGFEHRVTASHVVSLGLLTDSEQRRIAERIAAAGIGIVALPHTNLFLQGRGHAPMPRGLTAVAALRDAGAMVCAGADNLQDPFNPVGRGCPFETAGLMIMAAHLGPDDAWACVSEDAARVIGAGDRRIAPGLPADLVAVRGTSVRQAIADASPDRVVWRAGRLLAG